MTKVVPRSKARRHIWLAHLPQTLSLMSISPILEWIGKTWLQPMGGLEIGDGHSEIPVRKAHLAPFLVGERKLGVLAHRLSIPAVRPGQVLHGGGDLGAHADA